MLAPKELKEVHPLGKAPVIGIQTPDMENELIISESGTIVEYLAEHFGTRLIPRKYPEGKEGKIGAETAEYLRYKHFMHYAEGSLMTILLIGLVVGRIKDAPVPFFIKPITRAIASKIESSYIIPNTETHFNFCEQQLVDSPGGGPFFCGTELTAADFLMIFPLEVTKATGLITREKYPKLCAYVETIQQRDAYKRSITRAEKETGKPFAMTVRDT